MHDTPDVPVRSFFFAQHIAVEMHRAKTAELTLLACLYFIGRAVRD